MWYLQVVRYENLSARADQNRITIVPIPPRRGQIIDRNGAVLARNHRDYTLSVTRTRVDGKIDYMLNRLSELVYLSPGDRRPFLRQSAQSGPNASDIGTVQV